MSISQISIRERFQGGLIGAVVGDALGVPVEFLSRELVRQRPVTAMRGYGTHRQPPGTWSDDSSLLLCTLDSLIECGGFAPVDLADRFVRWQSKGLWTPYGDVFDIGMSTAGAISYLARGYPPEEVGGDDELNNGNGSLMRILPMALWYAHLPYEEMVTFAQRASSLTHRHPRSLMACGFYCILVQELLQGTEKSLALNRAIDAFQQIYQQTPFLEERKHFVVIESGDLGEMPEADISSSGYVVHTLIASIWCLLTTESLTDAVLKAVNLGSDTDTTGSVTGGLAGIYYGEAQIPDDWKSALARSEDVFALFAKFVAALPG